MLDRWSCFKWFPNPISLKYLNALEAYILIEQYKQILKKLEKS